MRTDLPSGTVTLLFTDVEGSTKLLHELGTERYADALAEHRRIVRTACAARGGVEVDTQGDAFFVAFPTPQGAVAAAAEVAERLAEGPIRVRIGIHTGTPHVGEEGYIGPDVHRAARIAAVGHGGQVLVSASSASLLPGADVRDLGEHRLKDLSAPERIYQLGEGSFPPLQSLHRTNLPVPATPFLGRERELAEVIALLSREDVRLLTLTGPGGAGKTRLALQAAAVLGDDYRDGVWWVPLAPLHEPQLVLEEAARAVGAAGDLVQHLADKSLLLLFDNFEHLPGAATEVSALLAGCPRIDVLTTSREALHVTGEHVYEVPPLDPEEGVELFVSRALAADRDFRPDAAVAAICRRLDDLPLAIELAAARVRVLSPEQILDRLERRLPLLTGGARDAPQRQRTLRATIEWSHELLSPEEQQLFARLAVFRGGFTVDAAERVAGAELDVLQSLVEKSLLRHGVERVWMLATIHEYALEQLEASGEADELRRRHADHYFALADEAEPHLRGHAARWTQLLEREHDNLRAALDHFEAAGETQLALRLAAALSAFWMVRGHLEEGQRRLEALLASDGEATSARAQALNAAGRLAGQRGDRVLERRYGEEALALAVRLADAASEAVARHLLGGAAAAEGDWLRGKELVEQSLEGFRAVGDEFEALVATRTLAWIHGGLGDRERARELTEENLRRARSLGNKRVEARALGTLGMNALREGRIADAFTLLDESYAIDRELGYSTFVAIDLVRFAAILADVGEAAVAARLIACADALREGVGFALEPWAAGERERTLSRVAAALEPDRLEAEREQGRSLSADDAGALARTVLRRAVPR